MQKSLDTLRDRSATTAEFRRAARIVCDGVMKKMLSLMREHKVEEQDVVIVLILRAAIAFLDAAAQAFPNAPVGILGLKRDERTFDPQWYYENLPPISGKSAVIVLDPMLATGGSSEAAALRLEERGADLKRTYFAGIVAAPEGLKRLTELISKENIVLAAVDDGLEHGMIVPGVGDFGDRYFGYTDRAIIGAI